MADSKRKYTSFFGTGQYETQEQLVELEKRKMSLVIGIPKEETMQENRVALVPSGVSSLIMAGHRVVIESGAGSKSFFSDHDFSEMGAEITIRKEEVFKAQCIIKVAPPTMDEIKMLHQNQVIVSPLHLPYITAEYLQELKAKRAICLAMEYMQDQDQSFPVVRIMSEMAGVNAVLIAAELMSNSGGGNGVLLGGISGVPPASVVILGSGVVAEYAVRAAVGLGASVKIFDNNIYKLMRIQNSVGMRLYTSSINPVYLERALLEADVVIGAIHSELGRAPVVVSEDLVRKMKNGAIIVDVSIDQGGCFATSRVCSHEKPTFVEHGVIHYCVPNISSRVSRTGSIAISNILTPILLEAGEEMSFDHLLYRHMGLRHGVYTYKGCITNQYLAQKFKLKYTDIDLLLASIL